MDIKKLSEEYRQVQQIRSINRVTKKAMAAALVQFHNVEYQKGSGPRYTDVTIDIRKGVFPDLGVIVFHNKTFNSALMGSFIFNDKLPCDSALKIVSEDGKDEDINLVFPSKHSKDDCVCVLKHYLNFR